MDRCTTCHIAADRKGFEDPRIKDDIFRTHPRMHRMVGSESMHPAQTFGCTPCHGGRDRATSFWSAGHSPETEAEKAAWTEKWDWKFDRFNDSPVLPLQYAEAGCYRCHAKETNFPEAPRLDAGMRIVESLGCWGCHRIDGLEKQGLPKVGPSLERVAAKVPRDWTTRWVMDPAAFRANTKMPTFFYLENFVDVSGPRKPDAAQQRMNEVGRVENDTMVNAIVAYLYERSRPVDVPRVAGRGDAARGAKLISERGCFGCHEADPKAQRDLTGTYRQFGPNLAGVGSKASRDWIYHWIRDPKAWNPDTKMPNLRLSESDALDIAEYLVTLKGAGRLRRDGASEDRREGPRSDRPLLPDVDEDPLRREGRAREDGRPREGGLCRAEPHRALRLLRVPCDPRLRRRQADRHRADRGGIQGRSPAGLRVHPHPPHAARLVPDEAARAAHLRPRPRARLGREAPDAELPALARASSTRPSRPCSGSSSSTRRPTVVKQLSPAEAAIERGRRIVKDNNCQGCHVIEGFGGSFRSLVADASLAPPIIQGEGAKVQSDWLFGFLEAPKTGEIRPWLEVHMPTFGFTDAELNDLTLYFASLDRASYPFLVAEGDGSPANWAAGKKVFELLKCAQCHPRSLEDMNRPGVDRSTLAPNLQMAATRLRHDWIADWIRRPDEWMPGTRMPTNFPKGDDGHRFSPLAQLFDAPSFAADRAEFARILGGDERAKQFLVEPRRGHAGPRRLRLVDRRQRRYGSGRAADSAGRRSRRPVSDLRRRLARAQARALPAARRSESRAGRGALSLDVTLFYGSLGIALAAVVLFLWLMRRPPRAPELRGREAPALRREDLIDAAPHLGARPVDRALHAEEHATLLVHDVGLGVLGRAEAFRRRLLRIVVQRQDARVLLDEVVDRLPVLVDGDRVELEAALDSCTGPRTSRAPASPRRRAGTRSPRNG